MTEVCAGAGYESAGVDAVEVGDDGEAGVVVGAGLVDWRWHRRLR